MATNAGHVKRYGIVAGESAGKQLMRVAQIVEKPSPEKAPSRMGVAGRYILTPGIFEEIRNQPTGVGGEIQLTDAIAALMANKRALAYRFQGRRFDCGSRIGLVEATIEFALDHEDLAEPAREYMRAALAR